MRSRAAAVLALCWLAACGDSAGDNPNPGSAAEEAHSSGAATRDPSPEPPAGPPVQPVTRPEQTMAAGTLTSVDSSGVTGSVSLRGIAGQQTEVSLNVAGLTGASRRMHAAVVRGTCEQAGSEVARIGPIAIGPGNVGAITDTLAVPAGTVMDGKHAILVKGQNATPPLACASLPDWQPVPPTG